MSARVTGGQSAAQVTPLEATHQLDLRVRLVAVRQQIHHLLLVDAHHAEQEVTRDAQRDRRVGVLNRVRRLRDVRDEDVLLLQLRCVVRREPNVRKRLALL